MSSSQSRVVLAALVHGGHGALPDPYYLNLDASVFPPLWGGDRPSDLVTFVAVEGRPRAPLVKGSFILGRNSLAALEDQIARLEGMPSSERGQHELPSQPHLMLAIGSREFSQAFARFWGIDKDNSTTQWGIELFRKFATAQVGSLVWFDNQGEGSVHETKVAIP